MYKRMKHGIAARLLALILVVAMVVPVGNVYAEGTDEPATGTIAEGDSTTEVTAEDAVYLPITFKDARRDGVFFDKLLSASGVVCFRRLLNQSIGKSPKTYNLHNHERSASYEKKRENHCSL